MKHTRERVRSIVREMLADIMSEDAVWGQIDEVLKEELRQSQASWSFTDPPVELAIRVGSEGSEVWFDARIDDDLKWQADEALNIPAAIKAVDKVIESLNQLRAALVARGDT